MDHAPTCPRCHSEARWAGSPEDSGFLAYCPMCDDIFHSRLPENIDLNQVGQISQVGQQQPV